MADRAGSAKLIWHHYNLAGPRFACCILSSIWQPTGPITDALSASAQLQLLANIGQARLGGEHPASCLPPLGS